MYKGEREKLIVSVMGRLQLVMGKLLYGTVTACYRELVLAVINYVIIYIYSVMCNNKNESH